MCFFFNFGVLFSVVAQVCMYSLMITGWSSNSNYPMLGSIRSIAQTISYEVSLVLIFLCPVLMIEKYNMTDFMYTQEYTWFILIMSPLSLLNKLIN